MKISSNNTYPTTAAAYIIVTDADGTQDADDMLTGDFSKAYTSLGTASTFRILRTYSSARFLSYVAIAGHTFGDAGGTVEIKVNEVVKGTVTFTKSTRNSVIFIHFDTELATSIDVIFSKDTSTDKITITYISAGEVLPLSLPQNNEQSGYARVWLTDNKKIRGVVNAAAQPVAYIRQSFSRRVTLTINNVLASDMQLNGWVFLLDRIYEGGDFFIKENDGDTEGVADNPKSSYLCFDADMLPPKAHSATRQLNNMVISFAAFTGH